MRTFDAVVLNLMLPDGSGLDVLAGIRKTGDKTPVLLLTALDEVSDRIKGLGTGADDYLGKPFDLDELAARVRAVARHQSGLPAAYVTHNGIVLDPAALTATDNNVPMNLSRREFAILSALMEHPEMVTLKRRSGVAPLRMAGRGREQRR